MPFILCCRHFGSVSVLVGATLTFVRHFGSAARVCTTILEVLRRVCPISELVYIDVVLELVYMDVILEFV